MAPQKWTHGQTDKQTNRRTDRRTFRLIESIGPEGRCFENTLGLLVFENLLLYYIIFFVFDLVWLIIRAYLKTVVIQSLMIALIINMIIPPFQANVLIVDISHPVAVARIFFHAGVIIVDMSDPTVAHIHFLSVRCINCHWQSTYQVSTVTAWTQKVLGCVWEYEDWFVKGSEFSCTSVHVV